MAFSLMLLDSFKDFNAVTCSFSFKLEKYVFVKLSTGIFSQGSVSPAKMSVGKENYIAYFTKLEMDVVYPLAYKQ